MDVVTVTGDGPSQLRDSLGFEGRCCGDESMKSYGCFRSVFGVCGAASPSPETTVTPRPGAGQGAGA